MSSEAILYSLEHWIALGLIIAFLYGPWQSLVEALARQKVFQIRDDLFIYAAEGNIEFDNENYRKIRRNLNETIRFAHVLTWPHILITKLISKRTKKQREEDLKVLLVVDESLPKDVSTELNKAMVKAVVAVALMLVLRSPFLMVLGMCLMPFVIMASLLNNANYSEKVRRWVGKAITREMRMSRSCEAAA